MKETKKNIRIAMADDHVLLRSALASLIDSFEDCQVILEAGNGKELIAAISKDKMPDLVILDLNMPEMDGLETAGRLQQQYPDIKVLMLTMYDSELSLIRLLQAGVRGFLKKDIHPTELKFALQSVIQAGYYYSNHTTGKLVNLFRQHSESNSLIQRSMLNDQEIRFLKLACSDLTYKEIAQQMGLNPRAVDTLRDQLFVKLDVKSRVGLAMLSIRHGLVTF
ncbi:MAG: response regulator transcription factor [Chitinophagales bacterium]|nr:response regulator transcription factor [Chitinophagales bacterium]